MPRSAIISIKTEIVIPYDRQTFGAATKAEMLATAIQTAIGEAMQNTAVISRAWSAKHTTEEAAPVVPAKTLPAPRQ